MKKTVVTILLVLPFILIYFISFTGRILSEYTHIYVERIVCIDEKGNEYDEGDYIKISKGDVYNLNIKVYPELANNKKVTISNSDKSVCSVNSETFKVNALEYGTSKLIITSQDRHFVQYEIYISVAEDDILGITPNKTVINLVKGRTEAISVTISPSTTLMENRGLIWTSLDESIATVSSNGVVTGIDYGSTTIVVTSDHKPEVYAEIEVVVSSSLEKGVQFDNPNPSSYYAVPTMEFDLKTITFVKVDDLTVADVYYQVMTSFDSSKIDISRLDDGIIKFNESRCPITISAVIYDSQGNEYSDIIRLWYIG